MKIKTFYNDFQVPYNPRETPEAGDDMTRWNEDNWRTFLKIQTFRFFDLLTTFLSIFEYFMNFLSNWTIQFKFHDC